MAHNHRGQHIADPYLNTRNAMIAQQEMLAQRNEGLRGVNYNPEESDYDEAYGPANRKRYVGGESGQGAALQNSQYFRIAEDVQDRRVRGEN